MIWWLIVAGGAGWTFDDFCGTPPRKGPGPGPGPWWIRKLLAAVGGMGLWYVAAPQLNDATVLGAALLGGIGGVVLASIAGELMGGRAAGG